MAKIDQSPEQRGAGSQTFIPDRNAIELGTAYYDRLAREGHTKEERDRMDENARALREELPPGHSPEVLLTRIGPGPSGDVLAKRIGGPDVIDYFSDRDEEEGIVPSRPIRTHDLPLEVDPESLEV